MSKHTVLMNLLLIVQLSTGNPINFTELIIAYIQDEIIKVMQRGVFCVHKHGFLMPGHICHLATFLSVSINKKGSQMTIMIVNFMFYC